MAPGPDGVVHAAQVDGPASAPVPGPPSPARVVVPAEGDRHRAMREAIARSMTRSAREIPAYHLATTIDLGPATRWLTARNRELPVSGRLVPAALLLLATARALRAFPDLNGHHVDGTFRPSEHVHLGVAVSLRGGGLIAPALLDADRSDVDTLMRDLRDLVTRARQGRLRREETESPTVTVTSLGDLGVEVVHGVIVPPQVALVGFGAVVERPWAVDGLLGVRPVVTATLAADHRVSDGYTGARFLTAVHDLMSRPEEL